MEKRRVVITGVGAITPVGHTAEETWQAVRQGVCGIGPITRYDPANQKVKLAAEVKNFCVENDLDKREAKHMGRYSQFAMIAAREAMQDSGLRDFDPERSSVIVSSGIGGIEGTEEEQVHGLEKGFDRVSPFYIPMSICNMAAGLIAIDTGFRGMCSCPVAACAGGTAAVGDAFRYVRDGYAEAVLCGGAEAAITPLSIGGFTTMKALSLSEDPNRASIPFDKERSGFVMGEGAAILLLEEYDHAKARGAKIYAEVVGYGATCDAYHMTAPAPGGTGGARAMADALRDAGVAPDCVDYINAHGTSTQLNDSGETAAVRSVFGGHADQLMISSTKSMTGHMLGAAGAVEAVFTALALRDQFVPATINFQVPDEMCDLDIVPCEGRTVPLRYALSNSLGFGGHNGSILLKKWED